MQSDDSSRPRDDMSFQHNLRATFPPSRRCRLVRSPGALIPGSGPSVAARDGEPSSPSVRRHGGGRGPNFPLPAPSPPRDPAPSPLAAGDDSVVVDSVADSVVDDPASPAPASSALVPVYTVDESLDASGFGPFQLMMLCFTGLAWMGDAMEMMLLSFLGPSARCEWGITPQQEGRLTSAVFVGMFFGAPAWGLLADARGRRLAFFATTAVTFFAGLLSAASPSFAFLLFARFCVGVGLGGVPTAFSLFLEFLPSADRGVWLVVIELFWTFGSILQAGLAWGILPTAGWRVLLVVSALPLGVLLLAAPLVPESPHFSAARGDRASARATLERVAAMNGAARMSGKLLVPSSLPSTSWGARATDPWYRRATRPLANAAGLLAPAQRRVTCSLWFIFFSVAFLYYGVVLLTTEVHVDASEARSDGRSGGSRGGSDALACVGGNPDLAPSACARFRLRRRRAPGPVPGGPRRRPRRAEAIARRRAIARLRLHPAPARVRHHARRRGDLLAVRVPLFRVRRVHRPVRVRAGDAADGDARATAMGVGNAFARLGGILCPLFAVEMVQGGNLQGAVAIFAALAAVTAAIAFHLPAETKGAPLDARHHPAGTRGEDAGKRFADDDEPAGAVQPEGRAGAEGGDVEMVPRGSGANGGRRCRGRGAATRAREGRGRERRDGARRATYIHVHEL